MRRQGCSIKEIATALNVSKGSVSIWCQDVILTASQENKLKERQIKSGSVGRQIGANKNKTKRLEAIRLHENRALEELSSLSEKDLFFLGLGLYWGEGVKSRSGMASLVNSDPGVIRIGKLWFEKCLSVQESTFRPYIYVSVAHCKRQKELIKFWSKVTGLKEKQFKVIILKSKPQKVYENHDTYHGVLSLRVAKSTDLKYRIKGLIEACKQAGN